MHYAPKRAASGRHGVGSKGFLVLLAVFLIVGCVVGGTVAWLITSSSSVTNTFTYGNIDISLAESTGPNYKIIPGTNIEKDPTVTVTKGSEACWLFVKIEETGKFVADKVTYDLADGWTALEGVTGVYYREVAASDKDQAFGILLGNQITVLDTLTKDDIAKLMGDDVAPKLTFKAYAVQKENISTAKAAWEVANPSASNP